MTSHAALVARGWGKCCIVGCGNMHVEGKVLKAGDKTLNEGDWLTLNGTKGNVYEGQLKMIDASSENQTLMEFLKVCDSIRTLKVRTNADTPEDARKRASSAPKVSDYSGLNTFLRQRRRAAAFYPAQNDHL